jgi:hypothetical protein
MSERGPELSADDGAREWLRRPFPFHDDASYWFTRFVLLRGLGFVYSVAFLSLSLQLRGLIGSRGLLPAAAYLDQVRTYFGDEAFLRLPTLFFAECSDRALTALSALGLALSLLVLAGFANALVLAVLWVLYLSFVNVGQVFYGYGWELLLLEAGFLAVFFAAPWSLRPFPRSPPPRLVVWLYRWLLFRVMFGAGLIKLRGDPCWVHLTCLVDHYETQPNPGPLSWYFHHLPRAVHVAGALFNHFVELLVPFFVFGPRRARHAAGAFTVLFQALLILSGNLSFLNWLTIAVTLACFDDSLLGRAFPRRVRERVRALAETARESMARRRTILALGIVVGALSIAPVVNLLSPHQQMNASFVPLPIVNTYGAFGSVEHERHEVVLEGTWDDPLTMPARWLEYEFPAKPGDPKRRPRWITPYHYRLDWQMWFAGLGSPAREPWIVKLVYELLRENPAVTSLLARDPFVGHPPRYVRAVLYRYRFTDSLADGWWRREPLGEYLRPLSLDDQALRDFLERRHWLVD